MSEDDQSPKMSGRSSPKKNKPREATSDEAFESFCFMVLEEFMMKKHLTKTLETFRAEYPPKDEVFSAVKFLSLLSGYINTCVL